MKETSILLLAALVVGCGSSPTVATSSPSPSPSPSLSAFATAAVTKPPFTQPQLPLPTNVRWGIDRGSPDDPQGRSLLELYYEGSASGFDVVDGAGSVLLQFPIAGSGIFGPETCIARGRKPQESATWISVDAPTLDLFIQRYRTYRVVATGIPAGRSTLELTDSGCRPL